MPTIDEQRAEAMATFRLLAAITVEPTLEEVEAETLIDKHLRARIWATAIAKVVGDEIVPTTGNGLRYRCTKAGTTGATEPTWPTDQAASVADGTARWQENGPDFKNIYDVRAAVHEGWTLKAAKASANYQIRMGGYNDHAEQQIYDHCIAMAEKYAPVRIG